MKGKITIRKVLFGVIIIICVISVCMGIYWQFFKDSIGGSTQPGTMISTGEENEKLEKEFSDIFNNSLEDQGNNVDMVSIKKIEQSQDLVYTWATKKEVVSNRYDVNISIPRINIDNPAVEQFNQKIVELFVKKANSVLSGAQENTIYTVEYAAYVNTNILSLVIKSTLKEGNKPQRVIVQTYNYNLSTNEEMALKPLIEIKGLKDQNVETIIKAKVEQANKQAEELKKLNYNVYLRDTESAIYTIENTTNYFLGKDQKLYILYPYGNSNYTDEIDVIVF